MIAGCQRNLACAFCAMAAFCTVLPGCHVSPIVPGVPAIPRELAKVSLPDYIIEPPDILLLSAVRVVPLPTQEIQPLDRLLIQFPVDPGALNEKDLASLIQTGRAISDIIPVEPGGTVNLGPRYGKVPVAGLLLDDARAAVGKRLKEVTAKELVDAGKFVVELAEARGAQQIGGEHLVRQDGKIMLGTYGSVRVAGLTLEDARWMIETHLSKFLLKPEVSVDVIGYNSKVYYIVTDGAGNGQQVARFPVTGGETVLDALSQINGLPPVASASHIWVARPAPAQLGKEQILHVNWDAIVRGAATETNYQLLPGDRIFVSSQPLLRIDIALAKIISPFERIFGITLLGNATVRALGQSGNSSGSGTGTP